MPELGVCAISSTEKLSSRLPRGTGTHAPRRPHLQEPALAGSLGGSGRAASGAAAAILAQEAGSGEHGLRLRGRGRAWGSPRPPGCPRRRPPWPVCAVSGGAPSTACPKACGRTLRMGQPCLLPPKASPGPDRLPAPSDRQLGAVSAGEGQEKGSHHTPQDR